MHIIDITTCPVCENPRVLTRDEGTGAGPRLVEHHISTSPTLWQRCPWSGEDPGVTPAMPAWSQDSG